MLKEIISLFYPQNCVGCGRVVHRLDWSICLSCRTQLARTRFERHSINPTSKLLIGKCNFSAATSFFYYKKGNTVQQLIYALKYEGNTRIGKNLGEIIGQHLRKHTTYQQVDLVVPLPLHRSKKRLRGYNQCDSIAQGIATKMNVPFYSTGVKRIKQNSSQTQKGYFDRHKNVEGLFAVTQPTAFEGKSVLLIDDVITTGSTLAAFASSFNTIPNCQIFICTIAIAS